MIPSTAMSCFPGFCPAIAACSLDWKNLEPGIVPEGKIHKVQLPLQLHCARVDSPESSKDAKTVLDENIMGPLERFV